MESFLLSIGSNIDPEKNIPACIELLKKHYPSTQFSSIYRTEPLGPAGLADFWNLAAQTTADSSSNLKTVIRQIESDLKRVRDLNNKFAPRTIDIDILPQKNYQDMAFIIVPLAEIVPDEIDEETGKSYFQLAAALKKCGQKIERVTL